MRIKFVINRKADVLMEKIMEIINKLIEAIKALLAKLGLAEMLSNFNFGF